MFYHNLSYSDTFNNFRWGTPERAKHQYKDGYQMLALSPRRLVYSAVTLGLIALVTLGILGATGIAHSQEAAGDDDSVIAHIPQCNGIEDAQEALKLAANLGDNTTPFVEEDFVRLIEALEEAKQLEQNGAFREALVLEKRVLGRLKDMAAQAREAGNQPLYELMVESAEALAECLERPIPTPKPIPQPLVNRVYSAKFVCGENNRREGGFTPGFGDHPSFVSNETFNTEINVHNFSNRRVVFSVQATQANPLGAPRGKVSEPRREVLGPGQAVQINCRNINRMLHPPVPHVVCEGKAKAQAVLEELLRQPVLSAADSEVVIEISEVIKNLVHELDKAIELEKAGELREALRLERGIIERLNWLIDDAIGSDHERLAEGLTEARKLLQRCIRILAGDIDVAIDGDRDALSILPRVREGFVAIKTASELEVTGVYRASSSSRSISGGTGSGISMDVVQIQPHFTRHILPVPVEPVPVEPVPSDTVAPSVLNFEPVSPSSSARTRSIRVNTVRPASISDVKQPDANLDQDSDTANNKRDSKRPNKSPLSSARLCTSSCIA